MKTTRQETQTGRFFDILWYNPSRTAIAQINLDE